MAFYPQTIPLFLEGQPETVAVTAEAPVASEPTSPSGPLCANTDTADEACWMEPDARSDCHTWNLNPERYQLSTRSGQCCGGLGTRTGAYSFGNSVGGGVIEVPYVNGEIHGTQVVRQANGIVTFMAGWASGKRHGLEVRLAMAP